MSDLKTKICILCMATLLLVATGCVQPDDTSISEQENQTVEEEQTGLTSQEEYTVSQVNAAIDLIGEMGELAFPELRESNSEWFHDDFYIFVWKTDGMRVVYPPDLSGEGQDMSELVDFNDKSIGQIYIDIALSEEGEGWVDYYWPKPGETEPLMKHTFIKRASIGNETYLVGSGFYVDE
ncbi:cache domain-containing protein [Methanococcoides orientis]|uniref:cache domain-containing protein n=1 Tax=Methanococcoides orientis TaxID=2822137 RepID=UPI001E3C730A|nr:cache domain-containing protein [Methanococcoides orientis]UGV41788.1 cache domain-containing protein [Methanococcoides orientis]